MVRTDNGSSISTQRAEQGNAVRQHAGEGRKNLPSIDQHVPSAAHYDAQYLSHGRTYSIAAQLASIMDLAPRNVLEVGVGTGISAFSLRSIGVEVITLDVQPELAPDIIGDVRAIPRGDASFDVASCCQVLEHLPLTDLSAALRELRRVTRWRLVLSLPDITRYCDCALSLPLIGRRGVSFSLPVREPSDAWKAERLATMGHYWEIGMNGATAAGVTAALRGAGFDAVRSFRVRELSWHRFFIADIA